MHLLDAIVNANHRALAGDALAGVRRGDVAASLPLVVLTCFDPRMHPLMPEVLGIAEADFIWVTNAAAVVANPVGATARSLALACAVHGGKEIAVLGHTDCRFFRDGHARANNWLHGAGVDLSGEARALSEFFSQLLDEETAVRFSTRLLRASPFLSAQVPVHGLMVDTESGRLEWLVNGYEAVSVLPSHSVATLETDFKLGSSLPPIGNL